MAGEFQYFVVFAEMRTGSNFLETNLNAMQDVTCHGEAFNPHFIGYPKKTSLFGLDEAARDTDPLKLLQEIRMAPGINGFRYFHDHDARVFDAVMDDPQCAKIILTRNPAESYVSWKIARTTGQWKLTDATRRKTARAEFDAVEFAEFLAQTTSFQQQINRRLQVSGQTAFRLRYEDLNALDVINGLASFLGAGAGLEKLDHSLKVQNPAPLCDKVVNYDEMEQALAGADGFALESVPTFEPKRVAAVPSYIAAVRTPLLYMPIKGGPVEEIRTWLAALDGASTDQLNTRMSQKSLRQWKRANKGHRSFTVLRHPLVRAHFTYCSHILGMGKPEYTAIRQTLIRRYDLPVAPAGPDEDYDLQKHRDGFEIFLRFVGQNLSGQTSIRVDPAWCSQTQALQGFGRFALPDLVLRDTEVATVLPQLAQHVGCVDVGEVSGAASPGPFSLDVIYDASLERLAANVYQRDYLMFGFESWK